MSNMSAFGVPAGDRAEIVDAFYRFGAGQDLRDRRLFDSAFTLKARLDFTGPARRLGAAIPVFEGRQAIGDRIFSAIDALDTTHTVTNPRVTQYDGKHAQLSALVEAQHMARNDHGRNLLPQCLRIVRGGAVEARERGEASDVGGQDLGRAALHAAAPPVFPCAFYAFQFAMESEGSRLVVRFGSSSAQTSVPHNDANFGIGTLATL